MFFFIHTRRLEEQEYPVIFQSTGNKFLSKERKEYWEAYGWVATVEDALVPYLIKSDPNVSRQQVYASRVQDVFNHIIKMHLDSEAEEADMKKRYPKS
jgi:hypothetical protein